MSTLNIFHTLFYISIANFEYVIADWVYSAVSSNNSRNPTLTPTLPVGRVYRGLQLIYTEKVSISYLSTILYASRLFHNKEKFLE